MNNSVFGAPGVFGGPSIFGAHEMDPMFAASNPAHASVFGNMTVASGSGVPSVAVGQATAPAPSGDADVETVSRIFTLHQKIQRLTHDIQALQQRLSSARSAERRGRIMERILAKRVRINTLREKINDLQARSNPKNKIAQVVGKVKFGGGRRSDARDMFAEKVVDAWKRGDFAAARKHMKSYDNQNGTRLGLQTKARKHLNNPVRESQFLDWVKRNYGVLGGEKTNKVLGIARSKNVSGGRRKFSARKIKKIAGAAVAAAPVSSLTPGLDHQNIVRNRLARFKGRKPPAALLGGPRVAMLLGLPAHLRADRLSQMAGPMQRVRQRRRGGMPFLPVRQAVPQLKGLPRDQYRVKRNQMLVDRTVEQVLERLKADPNFINMTYEEKVAAAVPLAQAVDSEIVAVEAASDIQPPLPQEEDFAIEEMAAEADAAANWEDELFDEDFDFDDDFAGVFGYFGADTDAVTRAEAAAQAAVDAIEADVAATAATAEAIVADEEEDQTKKYLMYAGAVLAAYWLLRR